MELLVKLAALSLCVSAVTALLKKSDEALSLLLLLAAVLVGCAMLLPALSDLFDFCERVLLLTDLPLTLFVPVVKVTAIALVARFSCALCADAGQSALSSLLAAAGRCARSSARCRSWRRCSRWWRDFYEKAALPAFAVLLLCVSASAPGCRQDWMTSCRASSSTTPRRGTTFSYTADSTFFALSRGIAECGGKFLRGAMALMLLSLLCGLVESTAESAGRRPCGTRAISACWARRRSQQGT